MKAAFSRPTIKAATGLVGAAIVVFAAWLIFDIDRLDAWMPNTVTGLITVAVTITFVEGIVGRDERQRIAPWRDRLIADLRLNLFLFAQSAALDYAFSHLRTFKQPPTDVLDFFEFWLVERKNQDVCWIGPQPITISAIVHYGFELGNSIRPYRQRDLNVMTPDLVRAIDDITGTGEDPAKVPDLRGTSANTLQGIEVRLVEQVRALAFAVLRCDPEHRRLSLGGPLMEGLEEHTKRLLAERFVNQKPSSAG